MGEDSAGGRALRTELLQAIALTKYQFSALGCEMNHFYQSDAIYLEDEDPRTRTPTYHTDKDMYYTKGTIPGMRLPHAWLNTMTFGTMISTQDLAGKGRFTIFTGIGGKEVWMKAAVAASQAITGLDIAVFSIGWGQDYVDMDNTWTQVRGVEDDGAVLVRPDRFVCWRSQRQTGSDAACTKLMTVLKKVLCYD
jgi:hypothetical protein